ncbi:MAG: septum formation initiator family protein [Thermodesulfobacteriota bacterium]|nr:septum formation initiator family protein [Thermodesulfobacteriota bacterium]
MNRKYFVIVLLFVFVMLILTTFGQRGITRIYRLSKERSQIVTFNGKLREENQNLKNEIYSLKRDKTYVEEIARQELGLAKEDEIIYQFENPKSK